jgi:ABC-type branched-subunit amino acid transport system ATPase component
VTVKFGGISALDDVTVAVPAAGIAGLIGPNGAGKSTLFAVLSGLQRPGAGRVLVDGADITRTSPQRRARLGVARTFQRLELFSELTVRDHVVLAHRVRHQRRNLLRDLAGFGRRTTPAETAAVDGTLELLGLASIAHRPVHSLPLGTGRLVEVARAVATDPRVVLLDEPSSGLDPADTARLAAVIATLRDERRLAVLLVEHDVEMVLGLADEITVLDFGRVIARGTPAAIRGDAAVQTAYLGSTR